MANVAICQSLGDLSLEMFASLVEVYAIAVRWSWVEKGEGSFPLLGPHWSGFWFGDRGPLAGLP